MLTLICTMKSRKCSLKAGMSWFRSNSPWTVSLICALNMGIITSQFHPNTKRKNKESSTSPNRAHNRETIRVTRLFTSENSLNIRSMFGTVKEVFSPVNRQCYPQHNSQNHSRKMIAKSNNSVWDPLQAPSPKEAKH